MSTFVDRVFDDLSLRHRWTTNKQHPAAALKPHRCARGCNVLRRLTRSLRAGRVTWQWQYSLDDGKTWWSYRALGQLVPLCVEAHEHEHAHEHARAKGGN